MPNTRRDRFEKYAEKALRAMQASLFDDMNGMETEQVMAVLQIIHINLGKSLATYFHEAPTTERQKDTE